MTQRIVSASSPLTSPARSTRRNASTCGLSQSTGSKRPSPKTGCRRRVVSMRAGPVQQRRRRRLLRLDVDAGVVVDQRLHDRQVELAGVGGGEARVAVGGPLHRRPHRVAVGEPDVVAHPDLVAVVEVRRAGQRQQQRVDELDLGAGVVEQAGQPPPDADVGAHPGVGRVPAVHRGTLLRRHHLERELVVVAQERAPLRARRDVRRVAHDVDDGRGLLLAHRVVDARHDGEVEGHVALRLLLGAEVLHDVLGPLVRLGEQDAPRVVLVDHPPDPPDEVVRLREVLAVRALPLEEVGDRVEPDAVDAEVEPEPQDVDDRVLHGGIVEVQVRLVGEEPVPVVLPADRVERPVARLGVDEDDPGVLVLVAGVAPHVEVAVGAVRVAAAGLEPRVLVARVVDREIGDDAQPARVRLRDEFGEVRQRAELGQDGDVVADVVPAVPQR